MTVGIPLTSFAETLSYVPVHQNTRPVRSFDPFARFEKLRQYILVQHGTDTIESVLHKMQAPFFTKLGVEKGCKAMLSVHYALDSDVSSVICHDPSFDLVRKIANSIWQWGYARAKWNEIVDAWNGIRSFDLGLPGFEVTLDYTTGHNEMGYSRDARTFLDGIFGFLVHWKGEHVMTIGFSLAGNRRLLLQQVQAVRPTGNRWMFRLPANRMEFIIDRLAAAFPRHTVHVGDGMDYTGRSLASYTSGLNTLEERYERCKDKAPQNAAELSARIEALKTKVTALETDRPRIVAAYRDLGRHTLTDSVFSARSMRHYKLAA